MKRLPNKCCLLGVYSYDKLLKKIGVTPKQAHVENLMSGGRAWDGEKCLFQALKLLSPYKNIEKNESETDNWDFKLKSQLLECRKTKVCGSGNLSLSLGPGNSAGEKDREKFDEKITVLANSGGGYILYSFDGKAFSIWWFPIKTLLRNFPEKFNPPKGKSTIPCSRLNNLYRLSIPTKVIKHQ